MCYNILVLTGKLFQEEKNMSILDQIKTVRPLEGLRLSTKERATVRSNGQLTFSPAASRLLEIEDINDCSLVLYPLENGNFAAIRRGKDDSAGFKLCKSGPYSYINFKDYLEEVGEDYKSQTIIYDIVKTGERMEDDRAIFKFSRRNLPKATKRDESPGMGENPKE